MSVTKFDKLQVNSIKIGNNGNLNVHSNNIKYRIHKEGEFSILVKDTTDNDTSGKIALATHNGKNNINNSIDGYGILIDNDNIKIGYSNFDESFENFSDNLMSGLIIDKDKVNIIGSTNISADAESISNEEIENMTKIFFKKEG